MWGWGRLCRTVIVRARTDAYTRGRAGEERKEERGRETGRQAGARKELGRRYKGEERRRPPLSLVALAHPSPTTNTRSGSQAELDEVKATQSKACKDAVKFADESPAPPATLAKELEFPDAPSTDYNLKTAPAVCLCVCVCVLVCLCACVLVLVLVREFGTMDGKGEISVGYHPAG